jgi:hypothetical protein
MTYNINILYIHVSIIVALLTGIHLFGICSVDITHADDVNTDLDSAAQVMLSYENIAGLEIMPIFIDVCGL